MKQFLTPRVRRWGFVAGTAAVALLSGHVMQRNALTPPDVTITFPTVPASTTGLTPPPIMPERTLETQASRQDQCDTSLRVSETPGGNLNVVFHAPCHADAPITVKVGHLMADEVTDASGVWSARVPALSADMRFEVTFGGETLVETAALPDRTDQQHVILAWTGAQVFHVRTETFQADAVAHGRAKTGAGVFTRVGDGRGASFEILSFPSMAPVSNGVVRLYVDAEVTSENCGREVATLAYQTGFLGALRPTEIAYTMPDCDRVGDVIRLQNLFRDMRLAER